MFFFSRNSALVVLAIVGVVLAMAALDAPKIVYGVIGAVEFVILLAGLVFDRYEGPKG